MASDPVPTRDATFYLWAKNLSNVAAANASTLNLTLPQAAAIATAVDDYSDALDAAEAARANAKGMVSTKKGKRKTAETLLRNYAKQWLANPAIPNALKGQLGLNPEVVPSGPVTVPLDVSAAGDPNGTNTVKWNRNGNFGGTVFIVEAKIGDEPFRIVAVTSKSRFDHPGQTPGVQAAYRVTAQRGSAKAGPSNQAVVYLKEDSAPGFLKVA